MTAHIKHFKSCDLIVFGQKQTLNLAKAVIHNSMNRRSLELIPPDPSLLNLKMSGIVLHATCNLVDQKDLFKHPGFFLKGVWHVTTR